MCMKMRADLKRVCTALFDRYRATVAGEVEELQRIVDPRTRGRGENSEVHLRGEWLPLAKRCKDVLVSAHNTFITPSGTRWFSLLPRRKQRVKGDDSVKRWYNKASEVMFNELAESNFYSSIHEVYNDRVDGGTAAAFIGGDEVHPLFFVHIPLGTFAIAEDNKGRVNTLVRRFKYTPQQALEEWGEEALPLYVRDMLEDERKRYTEEVMFVQLVRPRKDCVRGWQDVPEDRREFEGFYMDEREYNVIKEEGFYEFPFLVTRFLRGSDSPYGEAPGLGVLPVMKQYMKLDRLMDVQAETAAFPRILQLAGENKQVDVRAGGVTTVSLQSAQLGYPREWATGARYDAGMERLGQKADEIRGAYFVDMLNAISDQDKTMTAREIMARESEKVLAFSSSFTALMYDFQGAMRRIMAILLRREAFPEEGMPDELFEVGADGRVTILNPNVSYLGKIAQAIEVVMARGVDQLTERVLSWVQSTGDPYMLRLIKQGDLLRVWMEGSGATVDILLSEDEEEALQRQMEAEALQRSQMEAEAAGAQLDSVRARTIKDLR